MGDIFRNLEALLQGVTQQTLQLPVEEAKAEPRKRKLKKKKKKPKTPKDPQTSTSVPLAGQPIISSAISPLARPPAASPAPPSARVMRPASAGPVMGRRPATADTSSPEGLLAQKFEPYEARYNSPPRLARPSTANPRISIPTKPATSSPTVLSPSLHTTGHTTVKPASCLVSPQASQSGAAYTRPLSTYERAYAALPKPPPEVDPLRQELPPMETEGRYKAVLQVPAHVLAQSFYHTDKPSAVARCKELQRDLLVVRKDKKILAAERQQLAEELKRSQDQLIGAQSAVRVAVDAREDSESRLLATQRDMRRLLRERDEAREELRLARESMLSTSVGELKAELSAAHAEISRLQAALQEAQQPQVAAASPQAQAPRSRSPSAHHQHQQQQHFHGQGQQQQPMRRVSRCSSGGGAAGGGASAAAAARAEVVRLLQEARGGQAPSPAAAHNHNHQHHHASTGASGGGGGSASAAAAALAEITRLLREAGLPH